MSKWDLTVSISRLFTALEEIGGPFMYSSVRPCKFYTLRVGGYFSAPYSWCYSPDTMVWRSFIHVESLETFSPTISWPDLSCDSFNSFSSLSATLSGNDCGAFHFLVFSICHLFLSTSSQFPFSFFQYKSFSASILSYCQFQMTTPSPIIVTFLSPYFFLPSYTLLASFRIERYTPPWPP